MMWRSRTYWSCWEPDSRWTPEVSAGEDTAGVSVDEEHHETESTGPPVVGLQEPHGLISEGSFKLVVRHVSTLGLSGS